MKQSIRAFKQNDELIKDLEEKRELFFPDIYSKQIFKTYLAQYGYFSFVKKMSNDLMYSDIDNKTFKKEFTSNNLRYLFDIDRNISSIIFKYFRNIEFLLNSSLLKIIAKKINKKAKCPYIAVLTNEDLMDIFPMMEERISNFKKVKKNTCIILYEDIFKNFNNIDFDCKKIIKENMSRESEEIKNWIINGWFKNSIDKWMKKTTNNWEYLDIFSLFQILTFSQLSRIFSYLSTSNKNEVIKEFFNDFTPKIKKTKLKEQSFEELIKIFSNLRNVLMHNGCLMKFTFKINEDIKANFEQYFGINISSLDVRLNEVILIMELIINSKGKIFKEINESIENKFKNRSNRPDKVSQIVFDIIYKESRIEVNSELLKEIV